MLVGYYPVLVPVTAFCILFSAAAAAIPAVFVQKVIAEIEVWASTGDWASAAKNIVPSVALLASLYVLSIIAVTAHSQLMAYITQGFLAKLRRTMFDRMQNLPIRFFDTNKHGDIMSHYTNDIDTLRQLVSQSLPDASPVDGDSPVRFRHYDLLQRMDDAHRPLRRSADACRI